MSLYSFLTVSLHSPLPFWRSSSLGISLFNHCFINATGSVLRIGMDYSCAMRWLLSHLSWAFWTASYGTLPTTALKKKNSTLLKIIVVFTLVAFLTSLTILGSTILWSLQPRLLSAATSLISLSLSVSSWIGWASPCPVQYLCEKLPSTHPRKLLAYLSPTCCSSSRCWSG